MARKEARLNLRVEEELKKQVQEYCDRRGIAMSDLITRFFRRIVRNEESRNNPGTK